MIPSEGNRVSFYRAGSQILLHRQLLDWSSSLDDGCLTLTFLNLGLIFSENGIL